MIVTIQTLPLEKKDEFSINSASKKLPINGAKAISHTKFLDGSFMETSLVLGFEKEFD